MHNHHFFIQQLSERLDAILKGFRLVSCFSQNKDELIVEFNNGSESFFIKAYLNSEFCCLSFPTEFKRARKNSIDLFNAVLLKKVIQVQSLKSERAFIVELENEYFLFFKMFGNQANILLFEKDTLIEIFRKNFKNDLDLKITDFKIGIEDSDEFELGQFYINKVNNKIQFSLKPGIEIIAQYSDPIKAVNEFFYLKVSTDALRKEKQNALRIIADKEKKTIQYLDKTSSELKSLEADNHYQVWADLIMANMHQIQKGIDSISLPDFTTGAQHLIKLKQDQSPQQNAANFYRKAKNKAMEISKLSESISDKEAWLKVLQSARQQIEIANKVDQIKSIIEGTGILQKQHAKSERLPFRLVEFMGYSILIGKSATDNDELTLKHTFKDDLWLHAKDVSGSHVVIKYQSGKNFPKDVIERAAQLAAFYSKRKGESLCPVAYTPKKFVRKRKGDPAGLVVVEKETVILVEPKG